MSYIVNIPKNKLLQLVTGFQIVTGCFKFVSGCFRVTFYYRLFQGFKLLQIVTLFQFG